MLAIAGHRTSSEAAGNSCCQEPSQRHAKVSFLSLGLYNHISDAPSHPAGNASFMQSFIFQISGTVCVLSSQSVVEAGISSMGQGARVSHHC